MPMIADLEECGVAGGWHRAQIAGQELWTRHRPPAAWPGSIVLVLDLAPAVWRRATAVHEAGHAVVALAVGFAVTEVVLPADDDGGNIAGQVDFHGDGVRGLDLAAVYAAGEVAQHAWLWQQGLHTHARGWAGEALSLHDRTAAAAMFAALPVPVPVTWGASNSTSGTVDWQAVCGHAASLVVARWPAVLALSQALDHRGRLTGADVIAIVAGETAGHRPIHPPQPGPADRPVAV